MGDTRHTVVQRIVERRLIAIIRLKDGGLAGEVAHAIREGGVDLIEFTMTTPGALRTLETAVGQMPEGVTLGAGTVLDGETARAAILAGASFLVSPSLSVSVLEMGHRYGVPVVPGVYTATEVLRGLELGADLLKLFPAAPAGPAYLKSLRGPFPQAAFVPTGGVNLDNARAFLDAGAAAVAIGGELVNNDLVQGGKLDEIKTRAEDFRKAVG